MYGFIRSAVEERGSSCRKTSRSSQVGTSFSIPITLMSTSGSVVHMRPLPSDSTTETVPVSATAKLTPLIPTRALKNSLRRCRRAVSASSRGIVGELGRRVGQRAGEQGADLLAVLVDRRDQDVRGRVVGELDDELGQIGLPGA